MPQKVKDLMHPVLVTVDPDDTVDKTISLMLEHQLSSLPVVDAGGRLLGMISEFDLLDLAWDGETSGREVFRYMTRRVRTVEEQDDLGIAAELFRQHAVRRLPVMREERLVGYLSEFDMLPYFQRLLAEKCSAARRH